MAVLPTNDLIERIYDVLEGKFETYAATIASDVEPIRTFDAIPPGDPRGTPAVGCFLGSWEDGDSPQDTGSDIEFDLSVAAVLEVPYIKRAHARKVHDFRDALVLTLKEERELLHPDTGAKLAWLHHIWPVSGEIRWYPSGRGKKAFIDIRVRVWIGEAESY